MLKVQIENTATVTFGTVTQLERLVRDAAIARLTDEAQLEYCHTELQKILNLSPACRYKAVRDGHHVALVDVDYPHQRQAMILEVRS